ncbi:MAG: ornithine carbamoyltransferase [Abditibacteriales bacterium]|nr:ornithine carbamoyltransferase [Abditibacteriales bacterium]MDW8364727.1 ornithine carbamoyltransferase [Abditibacteriales bacterium]
MTIKHLTSINDLSPADAVAVLNLAERLKAELKGGIPHPLLRGKTLALIFEKPSLRTRTTFDVGMYQLGGYTVYMGHSDIGPGTRETVPDIARNLSRWVDGIVTRTFAHSTVVELAQHATVPVINGLCDEEHPCQALADMLTLREHKGGLQGKHLAYVGDGNNVAHSLMLLGAKLGVNVTVATPAGYEPMPQYVETAQRDAAQTGAFIRVIRSPEEAVATADAIYTDTWTSMGRESEAEQRRQVFPPYQVNARLLRYAKADAIVMHCLPAHRGEEITDDVMDGPRSVVFDQAENRLHVQKAVLVWLMGVTR